MTLDDWVSIVVYVGGIKYDAEGDMDKVQRVKPVSPASEPTWMLCAHAHWRVYQSLGYRECDKCKQQRPIFNDIRHQR